MATADDRRPGRQEDTRIGSWGDAQRERHRVVLGRLLAAADRASPAGDRGLVGQQPRLRLVDGLRREELAGVDARRHRERKRKNVVRLAATVERRHFGRDRRRRAGRAAARHDGVVVTRAGDARRRLDLVGRQFVIRDILDWRANKDTLMRSREHASTLNQHWPITQGQYFSIFFADSVRPILGPNTV